MNKKYIIIAMLLGIAVPTSAQMLTNNGVPIRVSTGGTLYVAGDFSNKTGSDFQNDGSVYVLGDITNDQVMSNHYTGTLYLKGSRAQTIGGANALYVNNINFDNASGFILSKEVKANGNVYFTSGVVAAATEPLTYTANASTATAASDASHVNGFVKKEGTGAFTYPVGDASKYQKVEVNASANATGIMVKYIAADAGSGTYGLTGTESTALVSYNTAEYWDIQPNSTATGTVKLFIDAYKAMSTSDLTKVRVAHKKVTEWLNEGGSASATEITSNAVSSWSPFSIGLITATLSTGELSKEKVVVYPNPTYGEVNIKTISTGKAEIYNMSGRLIKTQSLNKGANNIDITSSPSGLYILKIGSESYKLIKK